METAQRTEQESRAYVTQLLQRETTLTLKEEALKIRIQKAEADLDSRGAVLDEREKRLMTAEKSAADDAIIQAVKMVATEAIQKGLDRVAQTMIEGAATAAASRLDELQSHIESLVRLQADVPTHSTCN